MISDHAKERLSERYDIHEEKDIKYIEKIFFTEPHFKTVSIRKDVVCVRQIKFKGEYIQGIVDIVKRIIISIIPDIFAWEGNYKEYDSVCEKARNLLIENKKLLKAVEEDKKKQIINTKKTFNKIFKIGKYFIGKEIK